MIITKIMCVHQLYLQGESARPHPRQSHLSPGLGPNLTYDIEGLPTSAIDYAPGMWLNPLPDSGSSFGAVIFESSFAAADVGCSEFSHVSKIEYPPMSLKMSSVRSTRMLRTTLTMLSSVVSRI